MTLQYLKCSKKKKRKWDKWEGDTPSNYPSGTPLQRSDQVLFETCLTYMY